MKHTPGPWETLLAIVERVDGTPYDALSNGPDVLIGLNCWLMDHQDIDPQQADAAPELLEALEDAEYALSDIHKWATCAHSDKMEKIRAAIAKARGE